MSRRIVGGYIWKQELAKARRAVKKAREALAEILDNRPGQARLAILLAMVSRHLADCAEALYELETIQQGDNDDSEVDSI